MMKTWFLTFAVSTVGVRQRTHRIVLPVTALLETFLGCLSARLLVGISSTSKVLKFLELSIYIVPSTLCRRALASSLAQGPMRGSHDDAEPSSLVVLGH